jgi:hypothetical protein
MISAGGIILSTVPLQDIWTIGHDISDIKDVEVRAQHIPSYVCIRICYRKAWTYLNEPGPKFGF